MEPDIQFTGTLVLSVSNDELEAVIHKSTVPLEGMYFAHSVTKREHLGWESDNLVHCSSFHQAMDELRKLRGRHSTSKMLGLVEERFEIYYIEDGFIAMELHKRMEASK